MTSGSQVSNKVDVNFLVDQPSDTDFFGSHSKVADAVADAIGKPGATNVIGLLGGWGSGKSTVVRQMASWLKTKPCGANKHLFTYDAWLHQNDPPRRAFLEELIGELTAAKLVLYSNLEENAGLRQARQNAMPKIPVSLAPSDLFGMLVKVVATNRPAIRSDKSSTSINLSTIPV